MSLGHWALGASEALCERERWRRSECSTDLCTVYTDYDDGSLSPRKYSSDMTQIWFRSYTNTMLRNTNMETERVLYRSLYTDYDDGSLSHRKYSSDMTQIWFRSYTNTIIVNKYKYEDEATAIDLCTLIMTWCERKYFFNIWQIWKKV